MTGLLLAILIPIWAITALILKATYDDEQRHKELLDEIRAMAERMRR